MINETVEAAIQAVEITGPVPEPPREGDPGAGPCRYCATADADALWSGRDWRVLPRPWSPIPGGAILISRAHVDTLSDLPAARQAEFGVIAAAIERAIMSAGSAARVHMCRYGDGCSHFHAVFVARPLGYPQLNWTSLLLLERRLPDPGPGIRERARESVAAVLAETLLSLLPQAYASGMYPPDVLARRRRRRRRRRAIGMWVFSLLTIFALVVVGRIVYVIGKRPPAPAALSLTTPRAADASPARARSAPSPVPAMRISDPSSGLSYAVLAEPWQIGCPRALDSGTLSWQAGEGATAGTFTGHGTTEVTWYAVACSGLLPRQLSGLDLEQAATTLADVIYPMYYDALVHKTTVLSSRPVLVNGHQAWRISFSEHYLVTGLAWSSELAALIVVDRGPGLVPAMFYVSVPNDLDTRDVATLISSLRLR